MPQTKNQKRAKLLEKFLKEFEELKSDYEFEVKMRIREGWQGYVGKSARYYYVESQIQSLKSNMK